jgi:hypothetical protein
MDYSQNKMVWLVVWFYWSLRHQLVPSLFGESEGKNSAKMIVVGVDGGATKTSAVVMKISDLDSDHPERIVVGRSVSGSTNRNSVGNAAAVAAMDGVITQALKVNQYPAMS